MEQMTVENALAAARKMKQHQVVPAEVEGLTCYALLCPKNKELSARFKRHRFYSERHGVEGGYVQVGFDAWGYLIPVSEL